MNTVMMLRLFTRLTCILLLLSLAGCFSTPVPHARPAATATTTAKHKKPVIRYVRANDTLYSIGKKFGVDYHLIAKRNRIPYPYRIYLGQRLYIDRWAPSERNDLTAQKIRRQVRSKPVVAKAKKRVSAKKVSSRPSYKQKATGGRLIWPVKGRLTSGFGRRGSRMHDGIDVGAKQGTPIHAAASGTVVYSDHRLSGYGNLVILRHGNNLFTAYGHNQRNLVKKGQKVRAGDVIARVGQTGRASGPHLHFEVRRGSRPVDPLAYLPRR